MTCGDVVNALSKGADIDLATNECTEGDGRRIAWPELFLRGEAVILCKRCRCAIGRRSRLDGIV